MGDDLCDCYSICMRDAGETWYATTEQCRLECGEDLLCSFQWQQDDDNENET
jgi:hypothetical protein